MSVPVVTTTAVMTPAVQAAVMEMATDAVHLEILEAPAGDLSQVGDGVNTYTIIQLVLEAVFSVLNLPAMMMVGVEL